MASQRTGDQSHLAANIMSCRIIIVFSGTCDDGLVGVLWRVRVLIINPNITPDTVLMTRPHLRTECVLFSSLEMIVPHSVLSRFIAPFTFRSYSLASLKSSCLRSRLLYSPRAAFLPPVLISLPLNFTLPVIFFIIISPSDRRLQLVVLPCSFIPLLKLGLSQMSHAIFFFSFYFCLALSLNTYSDTVRLRSDVHLTVLTRAL